MFDIGFYHPLVIHFAISLLMVGVLLRWISLTDRVPFAKPAASILILFGVIAVIVAAWSGEDAHIAVEAIPGIAAAVREHQVWGERTCNFAMGVAFFEILALACARLQLARFALFASSAVGLVAVCCVMQTGKLGGALVYAHAGGVGIRSGDPEDVERLLLAGLYHQAQLDARKGRYDEAATLTELAGRLFPSDPAVQILVAESLLMNRHDPAAALTTLDKIVLPQEERRLRFHQGWLMADAFTTLGWTEAARTTLQKLQTEFPDSERLRRRLEQTGKNVQEQSHLQRGAS
jgi:uncharacterized membrane protein